MSWLRNTLSGADECSVSCLMCFYVNVCVYICLLLFKCRGRVFVLDFTSMRVCDLEFDLVRRLSTPSSSTATPTNTSPTPSCLTVWKYYCRDNFGWREYSEVRHLIFSFTFYLWNSPKRSTFNLKTKKISLFLMTILFRFSLLYCRIMLRFGLDAVGFFKLLDCAGLGCIE